MASELRVKRERDAVVIKKKYLTFDELAKRWMCEKTDIHYAIGEGFISPSIIWNGWACGFFDDITDLSGWVYLRRPTVTGAASYEFSHVSSEKIPVVDAFSGSELYRLMRTGDNGLEPVSIDTKYIECFAVFMHEEVELCELVDLPSIGSSVRERKDADNDEPSTNKPVPTVRDESLIAVIAALLALWPRGKSPTGKDLEKAAQAIDVKISDDTIRKALKAARNLAPTLPA